MYPGSADPSKPQSWNRYGYAWGDPVNLSDPYGTKPCTNDPITADPWDLFRPSGPCDKPEPIEKRCFGDSFVPAKGSRKNNLNEAGGNTLRTRFESVVPVRVSLVPTDAEFFHLGLRYFNSRFILICVENCLNL